MKFDTCYTRERPVADNCRAFDEKLLCKAKNYQKRFVYLHTLSQLSNLFISNEKLFFNDVDRATDKMKLKVLNSCASMNECLKSFLLKKM